MEVRTKFNIEGVWLLNGLFWQTGASTVFLHLLLNSDIRYKSATQQRFEKDLKLITKNEGT